MISLVQPGMFADYTPHPEQFYHCSLRIFQAYEFSEADRAVLLLWLNSKHAIQFQVAL